MRAPPATRAHTTRPPMPNLKIATPPPPKHTPAVLEVVARPRCVGAEEHDLRAAQAPAERVVAHVRHLGALLHGEGHVGDLGWRW